MTFAHGRPVVAIPGPSPVPDRVLRAMHGPSPDIYGEELARDNRLLRGYLMRLAGTGANLATYIGNGHAAWEAANANILSRGGQALVLATGRFGHGWAEAARAMGAAVEVMDFGDAAAADPARLAERLAADPEGRIGAVLVTQADTASSVRNDIPALRAAMEGHPALLAVDAIASLGCEPMRMDDWGVDVLVSASQKGLMTPPGLALVWFSDRARGRGGDLVTPYWDWDARGDDREMWRMWGGTPPVQLIWGALEALRMLLDEETLPVAFARHAGLAAATWAALDAWGQGGSGIRANVPDPARRALSVTAAHLPGADRLRAWTAAVAGVTLGIGLGAERPQDALRIAHMGHASAHQLLGTLAVMEAGMRALGLPHGTGALDAAAGVIAARA